jgi:hypothetical protein
MIGEDHVRALAQSRIAEYRSLLLALPRSYGKGQNDRSTPLLDWLERAKKLPAGGAAHFAEEDDRRGPSWREERSRIL